MTDQQTSTNINKELGFLDPYLALDEIKQRAVDMRLDNVSYQDIAANLKIEYQTARFYFMKNGPCYEAYEHMRKLRLEDRRQRHKKIEKEIEALAADAVITLSTLLRGSRSGMVRLLAATKALELNGFEAIKRDNPDEKITAIKVEIINSKVTDGDNNKLPADSKTK
jgi:hypothetical protein